MLGRDATSVTIRGATGGLLIRRASSHVGTLGHEPVSGWGAACDQVEFEQPDEVHKLCRGQLALGKLGEDIDGNRAGVYHRLGLVIVRHTFRSIRHC